MFKRFVRDMLTYAPAKLLPVLTGFITAPILTRLFLPAQYGNWALATGVVDLLFALSVSGYGAGAIRFYAAYKKQGRLNTFFSVLGGSLGSAVLVASSLSLLVLILLPELFPSDLYPLLFVSIAMFVAQAVYSIFMEVARAEEQSGLYTVLQILTNYGGLGLGLLLVMVVGLGVNGLMWGAFLATALTLPFLLWFTVRGSHPRIDAFSRSDARDFWRYAWPLAIGNIAMWALRLSDRYIIGLFRPAAEVGLYSVAYNISGKTIDILVALFLLSTGPMIVSTWENQGREATEKSLDMITRMFIIFCLPAAAGLAVLAIPFVSVLTADEYHQGYLVVGPVAFSTFAWGLSQLASRGILIQKRTHRIAINQTTAGLLNIGLNLLLIPAFGFVAAGYTTLAGYTVLLVMQAYASRDTLSWRLPLRTLFHSALSAALMSLAVYIVYDRTRGIHEAHIPALFASIGIGVLVYFATLFLTGEWKAEERAVIRSVWRRLARSRPAAIENDNA